MQKKRLTALLTATVVMVSACLAGCGAAGNVEESKSNVSSESSAESFTTEVTSTEVVVEELEPVTLTYWMAATKTEDADMVLDAVNEYLEDVLPNTTLEMVWIEQSEWASKWSKTMAAREEVDIAWLGWLNDLESEITMGSVMPIDDLLAEYGTGIVENLSEAVVEKHRSSDGNLYFLPAWQGMVGGRMGILIPHENVEIAGEGWAEEFQDALYAADPLPYWDEAKKKPVALLEAFLEANKQAGALGLGWYNRYGALEKIMQGYYTESVSTNFEVTLVGDTYYVEADTSKEHYDYYTNSVLSSWFANKGYVREDWASVSEGNVYWEEGVAKDQLYVNYTTDTWTDDEVNKYTGYAGYQIDAFYINEKNNLTDGFATGTVIPATSGDPERAMMFINLVYTDPTLYQMLVYGIEGTHYTVNTDGTITKPANVTYTGPANWQLGTCMNSLQEDASMLDYYERLKEAENGVEVKILDGFKFLTEDVSVEVSNLKAVNKEYGRLWCYSDWEQKFDERREKLIQAGLETVLEELVEQLTEYAAEKGRKVEVRGF